MGGEKLDQIKLGKTDLSVSRLGLGGLFTSKYGGTLEQSKTTILRALERGINYIDTAPAYFDSEVVIGKSLAGYDGPLVMSTKLGGRPTPFNPKDLDGLRSSFLKSLEDLGREYIDILFVHEPDRPGQYDWWDDEDAGVGPVSDLLDSLKEEGLIKAAGLGGTTAYKMARLVASGRFEVLLTAANFSILWREAELELLPAAQENGVAVIAGTPLQQGALAARYVNEIQSGARWMSGARREQFRAFYNYLDQIDIPIIELAHRFMLKHPAIACVLSGARSPAEIDSNVDAVMKGPLPEDVIQALDDIAAMVPFRPYDEPTVLPFNLEWKGPAELR